MPGIPGLPPGMAPPGTPGLPPGLAGLPGMPPASMASGLLSLAGHPGLPPVTCGPPGGIQSMALSSMAGSLPPGAPNPLAHLASLQRPPGSAPGGPPGLPHLPDSRDEKPPLAAMEERLKNSSSASPLSSLRGGDRGRSPGPPGASLSSRGSPSSGGGDRRPGSRSAPGDDSSSKRIKMEENARKSGHVSFLCFRFDRYLIIEYCCAISIEKLSNIFP